MKKSLIYFLIIFFSVTAFASDINIPAKVGLKDNEILCVMYYKLGTCSKCFLNQQFFESLINRLDFDNIRIIAVVGCNREKELEIFKKKYVWEYELIADDGKIRKFYDFGGENDIIVLNSKNKIVHNNKWNTDKDLKNSYDAIIQILGENVQIQNSK